MAAYEGDTVDARPTRTLLRLLAAAQPESWKLLASFGDDSSTYLWRVLAAERIMDLYRNDRAELRAAGEAAGREGDPGGGASIRGRDRRCSRTRATSRRRSTTATLLPLPDGATYGYAIDEGMGELAPKLGVDPSLYRALRPEALATLIYMTSRVREINGGKGELNVTSTVRDREYQKRFVGINDEATDAYSLHTTGWSFDIERKYASDRQAEAFQFILDRLRALDVIDYAVRAGRDPRHGLERGHTAAELLMEADVCFRRAPPGAFQAPSVGRLPDVDRSAASRPLGVLDGDDVAVCHDVLAALDPQQALSRAGP